MENRENRETEQLDLEASFYNLMDAQLPVDRTKRQPQKQQRTTSTLDFHKLKNELYMQLTNDSIYEYFDEVISSQGTEKKELKKFIDSVAGYREYKDSLESEVDDYSFIALRRLRLFSELSKSRLKQFSPEERKYAKSLHKVNISSANFIGHSVLNNNINKNIVIWGKSDDAQKIKKK